MERNDDLGPARDAMELYGPDQVTYELCRADFEKSRDGFLGIVIMAGANEDTMDDYVYYDNKLKLIKAGANSFSYDDHIIWAYINRERFGTLQMFTFVSMIVFLDPICNF